MFYEKPHIAVNVLWLCLIATFETAYFPPRQNEVMKITRTFIMMNEQLSKTAVKKFLTKYSNIDYSYNPGRLLYLRSFIPRMLK